MSAESAFELDAPIPTSIRVLTLDYNFIGKVGADALSQILAGSRQLKYLSLRRCMLEGRDIHRFCAALGVNKHLKVLRLASNKLGDEGIDHLSEALGVNTSLEHLDLFDVGFSNDGARFLERALRRSTLLLKTLRLSNTRVTVDHVE